MDITFRPNKLIELRRARGLTQTAFAEAVGLSRIGYHNLERGHSVPSASTLIKIARLLEIDPKELFDDLPADANQG
jgi:transcriptional regulator with XRE-family HTH domain